MEDITNREFGALEARIGSRFRDVHYLRTALTHSSYANEHPDDPTDTNERLESICAQIGIHRQSVGPPRRLVRSKAAAPFSKRTFCHW